MKFWPNYFDSNGLLCQAKPGLDGGDTPSHESLAWLANHLGVQFPSPISFNTFVNLLTPNYQLIRNPINYNNPSDTSRDQYRGFIIAYWFLSTNLGPLSALWVSKMLNTFPKNFLKWPKYPNGDVYSPQDYVLFHPKALWPMRFLGDIMSLLGVLTLCFWTTRSPGPISRFLGKWWWPFIAMNPPNSQGVQGSLRGPDYTSDDLGAIMILIFGRYFGTFLNRLNMWIYSKFRPGGPQQALDNYFASDDSPPINELYRDIIPKFFKG
jgi:hypothetical protein